MQLICLPLYLSAQHFSYNEVYCYFSVLRGNIKFGIFFYRKYEEEKYEEYDIFYFKYEEEYLITRSYELHFYNTYLKEEIIEVIDEINMHFKLYSLLQ